MRHTILLVLSGYGLLAEVASPSFAFLADGRVTLSCATAGAVIRCTFEDKDPDRSAGVYLAPVAVPAGQAIRARAFSGDESRVAPEISATARNMVRTCRG